jgi:amino acid transporter
LGGVVALFSGFTSSGGAEAFVIGAAIVNILFWLLLRSFGVAIAARMNLAAAEARLRASKAEE